MSQLAAHPKPSLAVDLAILTVADGTLKAVLVPRGDGAVVGGDRAMPGGFVHLGESPEQAVRRVLHDKTGLDGVHFEQLATYGAPDRDPRGHVVSIVYLAVVPAGRLLPLIAGKPGLSLAGIAVDWPGETGGPATALDDEGAALPLAFDHAAILGDVVKRLRGKLDYTPIGFAFLPRLFTLRQAQEVHEAILGRRLAKPAFRRKLADRHPIAATGKFEAPGAFRPAELYELKPASE
ncbi:NUDIX hydrolase [Zhengella mangrovi]|nr:NUDIX domain-containing protein [Zhengella mangrovi]